MKILAFGNAGLILQLDSLIDPEINTQIHAIAGHLRETLSNGIDYMIPAYCSLTIAFNPDLISFEQIRATILEFRGTDKTSNHGPLLHIPVCYENEYAPDLQWVADQKQLDIEDIVNLHTSREYMVYFIGFLPGFPYMGSTPKTLHIPRKEIPRKKVSAGAVGLAGMQTGIYPVDSPGGWQLIGMTPVRIFLGSEPDPFLVKNGDRVKFYQVTSGEYKALITEKLRRNDLYEHL